MKRKTPIEAFRYFIENDMMQKNYSKKQIIELIDLMLLPREREHIIEAFVEGSDNGYKIAKKGADDDYCLIKMGDKYYKEKYEK